MPLIMRRSLTRIALGCALLLIIAAMPASAAHIAAFGDAPPVITNLSIKPQAFKALSKGDSTTLKGGALVRFDLDVSEDVLITFKRAVGHKYVTVPGAIKTVAITGANVVRISGRLGGVTLKPGLYRLTARPIADNAKSAFRGFHIIK